jgi:hypothetical protein
MALALRFAEEGEFTYVAFGHGSLLEPTSRSMAPPLPCCSSRAVDASYDDVESDAVAPSPVGIFRVRALLPRPCDPWSL